MRVIVGLLLLLAGPARAEAVRIGLLRTLSPAPLYIAMERGYFRDAGLEAEFRFFEAAQPIAAAAVSGDIDVGITALTGGFFSLAGRGTLKVIGGALHEQPGYEGTAILASRAAYAGGLTSPAKLGGRSLGITQFGSSFHYMAGRIAEREGFDLKTVTLRPLQQIGNMVAAVRTGQVDATMAVASMAREAEASGDARIIGWAGDIVPYQLTAVFAPSRVVAERADMLQRFATAYRRGVADYADAFLRLDAAGRAGAGRARGGADAAVAEIRLRGRSRGAAEDRRVRRILQRRRPDRRGGRGGTAAVVHRTGAGPRTHRPGRRDRHPDPGGPAAGMIAVAIEGVGHRFGAMTVLDGIDLVAAPGQVLVLVGPSGCGKSTLLAIVAGLLRPTAGRVTTAGPVPPGCVNPITSVFQDFALLPWRTVAQNVSLVLGRLPRAEAAARMADALATTGLTEFADAWPRQLSGGMRQRVGIARALAVRPACLLMDEPLSALDAQTRALLLDEFAAVIEATGVTTIYVTHNLNEAVRLGHQVVVLSRRPGRVRAVVPIDRPILGRDASDPALLAIERGLWDMIRDDAAAAARERVDG